MNNKWKNIISFLIACLLAYLCGVSKTNSWSIISDAPAKDVYIIGEMLIVLISSFAACRFFIGIFNCD